jgi:hypothetical protein
MIIYTDNSQSEEVEPHPELILYFQETQKFSGKLPDDYNQGNEFYNIVSNIEQNIFLLDRLNERNLLKENNNMIDCGIGLGFSLFDFYLQSLSLNRNFTFTGIEKQKVYVDYLKENLLSFWNEELNIIEDDIMNHSYSDYNIVYSYTPFRSRKSLNDFYNKIVYELKSGSIIIENANWGLGYHDLLKNIDLLEPIEIDDIHIFVKR